MAIYYQLVNDHQNIKNKLYFIILAFVAIIMTFTFSILCIKRQYGEYNGPFLPGVCQPWWNDDTNPPIPAYSPTNTLNCGPKKIVWKYVNSTLVVSGYIQYCQLNDTPTPAPIEQHYHSYNYNFI